MTMMKINSISSWNTHECVNECLVNFTNTTMDDFSHGILMMIMILFARFLLNIEQIYWLIISYIFEKSLKAVMTACPKSPTIFFVKQARHSSVYSWVFYCDIYCCTNANIAALNYFDIYEGIIDVPILTREVIF